MSRSRGRTRQWSRAGCGSPAVRHGCVAGLIDLITGGEGQGREEAHPFRGLSQIHPNAAGIDIGAEEIVVCAPGSENTQIVKTFGNYTADLQAIGRWMREYHVQTVAMESTGVYWIPLFVELQRQGFECLLISSRSLRRVAGRKSTITDAQWIQTLHSYGLLEGSFRPQGDLVALRTLLRYRSQLAEHCSPHVLHMQKALLQMNVQLSQAVTDVTGLTGQKIIRAILAGERDPQALAALREPGCKKSTEEIGKALTGTWREEHLFVLQQSVQLYDFYTQQIQTRDEEQEEFPRQEHPSTSRRDPQTSEADQWHGFECCGWFWGSLGQTVIIEVGTDMSKFSDEKHFCSWLGLAPKHEISGGKVLKNIP